MCHPMWAWLSDESRRNKRKETEGNGRKRKYTNASTFFCLGQRIRTLDKEALSGVCSRLRSYKLVAEDYQDGT